MNQLPLHPLGIPYTVYGDMGYTMSRHITTGYNGAHPTPPQRAFNKAMSRIRVTVEWGFGRICGY